MWYFDSLFNLRMNYWRFMEILLLRNSARNGSIRLCYSSFLWRLVFNAKRIKTVTTYWKKGREKHLILRTVGFLRGKKIFKHQTMEPSKANQKKGREKERMKKKVSNEKSTFDALARFTMWRKPCHWQRYCELCNFLIFPLFPSTFIIYVKIRKLFVSEYHVDKRNILKELYSKRATIKKEEKTRKR